MKTIVAFVGPNRPDDGIIDSLSSCGIEAVVYREVEESGGSCRELDPDCVVIIEPTELSQVATARERFRMCPLIVSVPSDDAQFAIRVMELPGTDAFCLPLDPADFIERICRRAHAGVLRKELHRRFASLSARETEIVELITGGFLSKQIASRLSISIKTVEAHRSNIFRKVDVQNAMELTKLFLDSRAWV